MSEDKRPIGITLFAIFYLILALMLSVLYAIWHFETKPASPSVLSLLIIFMHYAISIGLFKRNRKIYYFLIGFAFYRVASSIIFSFTYLYDVTFPLGSFLIDLFWVIFYGFTLYYFSRPKIIQQFK